jgi:hypothetical protein
MTRQLPTFLAVLAGPLLLAACSDKPLPTASHQLSPFNMTAQAHLRAAAQGRTGRGFEDEILRLENSIPGLGGVFMNQDGKIVVYLTDLGRGQAAIAEIAKAAAVFRARADVQRDVAAGRVELRQGQFAFSQLVQWQGSVAAAVGQVPGYQGVDADESTNRVRVRVLKGTRIDPFERALAASGIPAAAVQLDYVNAFIASTLRDHFSSFTTGGMQIANVNGAICTLGYNLSTNIPYEYGFITAAHCNPNAPWSGYGGFIYQNVVNANYKVGNVFNNPTFTRTDAACGGNQHCTLADAMFASRGGYLTHNPWLPTATFVGTSYALGSFTETSTWRQNVDTMAPTWVGLSVDKQGRTTGWTRGTVSATCTAETVGSPYGSYVVLCSDVVDGSAAGEGDSGAPVFVIDGSANYAVGILFAGSNQNQTDPNDPLHPLFCASPSTDCQYLFSEWGAIEQHLSRTFYP